MYYQLVMVAGLFDAEVNHLTAAARLSSRNERREGASIRSLANWSERQVAWKDELFERIGLRHRACGPTALRESDCGHVVDRRRSGEPRTREHHRHLTGQRALSKKPPPLQACSMPRQASASLRFAVSCILAQPCSPMTAGSSALGLGQIALYVVARNGWLRGTFKFYAL